MTDFAAWLRDYVDSQQPPITAAEVARRTPVDARTFGRWLHGDVRPTPDKLRAVAPVLGVAYGELLTRAGYGAATQPEPAAFERRPLDVLAVELDRMLDPASPLGDSDRDWLRLMVDQAMEVKRPLMRKRRRTA
jgi:transcriptional regulator with XRE-family HTH domain